MPICAEKTTVSGSPHPTEDKEVELLLPNKQLGDIEHLPQNYWHENDCDLGHDSDAVHDYQTALQHASDFGCSAVVHHDFQSLMCCHEPNRGQCARLQR
ncbi:hypothetical protein QJS04_geneDACA019288 [Acorus gramineus]|uniref:Uncharacterized protein n=1 Tax=Acorus gramineus TaxID=55184 RepID=A0AAV9A3H6_ACOGR|nr:hypothetical protein QJS04_geneDACA019288 [Acorus gramineus]